MDQVPLASLPRAHSSLLKHIAAALRTEPLAEPSGRGDDLPTLARQERVLPLLASAGLSSTSVQRLPPMLQEEVARSVTATGVRNAILLQTTRRIAASLRTANVPVLLLKGIDLCERAYRNPSLRPMQDIDLLVREGDLDRALKALAAEGHAPIEPLPSGTLRHSVMLAGRPPLGAHVHLHWHLINASYPLPYAPHVDLEGLWARSLAWPGAPDAARVPSAEDLGVYLCEHLVKHCCEQWIFAVDLLLAVERLSPDPDRFREIARRWRVEHVCEAALRIVEALLPGMGADAFRRRVGPVSLTFAEQLFVRQVLSDHRGPGVNWLVYLSLCPTMGARAGQLWNGIFPPKDDLAALDRVEVRGRRWKAYVLRGWKAAKRLQQALFGAR